MHVPAPQRDRRLSLQEIRAVQLDVLDTFSNYCDAQGLRYMLAYGTLLGAVRHAGYIPWDDDIDVMMPRDDYERLRAQHSVAGLRVGGGPADTHWPYTNLKVANCDTLIAGDGPFDANIGVNIDVFPLDSLPSGVRRNLQRSLITILGHLLSIQAVAPRSGRKRAKSILLAALRPALATAPRRWLLRALDRLAQMPGLTDGTAGVLVGSYQWAVPSTSVEDTRQLPFEGRHFAAPIDVETVLKAKYGTNYMRPPRETERVSHHAFTAFWR